MRQRSPLLVAFFTVAIDLLGFGIVVPLLPRYGERFQQAIPADLQGLVVGLLMSSFSMVQFLFAPVWGKLSDRYGRRPILLIGLSGSVLAYLLFAYATWAESLALLFAARIGQGLCGATISTAQAVIADCTPPAGRAKGMALIGAGFGIGFTFGPVLGALTVSSDPTALSPLPGLVAASICLCGFLFAFFQMPETLRPGSGSAARRLFDLDGFRFAFGSTSVLVPLLVFCTAVLAFGQYEGTLARLTKDVLSFTDRDNFFVFAYIGLLLMFAQGVLVRRLVPIWGEVVLVRAGLLLLLLGMLGTGLTDRTESLWLFLAAQAATVVGFSFLTSTSQALISRSTAPARQGEILGVTQSCGAIARIIGPLLGNVVYGGTMGSRHKLPYFLSALLLAAALVMASRLRQPEQTDAASE